MSAQYKLIDGLLVLLVGIADYADCDGHAAQLPQVRLIGVLRVGLLKLVKRAAEGCAGGFSMRWLWEVWTV